MPELPGGLYKKEAAMKTRHFAGRLFQPLSLSFILSVILSSLLTGFFEHYSNMPFEDIARGKSKPITLYSVG